MICDRLVSPSYCSPAIHPIGLGTVPAGQLDGDSW
jgi:hypothetical protein